MENKKIFENGRLRLMNFDAWVKQQQQESASVKGSDLSFNPTLKSNPSLKMVKAKTT